MVAAVKPRPQIRFRLGDARHITSDNAWACVSTNLALPGCGSLMAGRRSGYPQAVLGGIGFLLTFGFGLKFVIWGVQHWSELRHPEGDPVATLTALWRACRWALLGMGLFGGAWLWALVTSFGILRLARQRAAAPVSPPRPPP
jgi:hypothetical protein